MWLRCALQSLVSLSNVNDDIHIIYRLFIYFLYIDQVKLQSITRSQYSLGTQQNPCMQWVHSTIYQLSMYSIQACMSTPWSERTMLTKHMLCRAGVGKAKKGTFAPVEKKERSLMQKEEAWALRVGQESDSSVLGSYSKSVLADSTLHLWDACLQVRQGTHARCNSRLAVRLATPPSIDLLTNTSRKSELYAMLSFRQCLTRSYLALAAR